MNFIQTISLALLVAFVGANEIVPQEKNSPHEQKTQVQTIEVPPNNMEIIRNARASCSELTRLNLVFPKSYNILLLRL